MKAILGLINDPSLSGLATLRHYPMERQIYNRFGKCGFAVDLTLGRGPGRRHLSVLVEAEARGAARGRKRSYSSLPGRVTAVIADIGGGGITYKVMRGSYKDASELFEYVEKIRSVFYERYRVLKPEAARGIAKIGEEVFHAAGISDSELYLGV